MGKDTALSYKREEIVFNCDGYVTSVRREQDVAESGSDGSPFDLREGGNA
jgi:hypothetical protein